MATPFPALRTPRPLLRWLSSKSPAERAVTMAVAAITAIVVLWIALWQPLARDADAMRASRAASAERLAEARRMVGEIAALTRNTPSQPASDARGALERALAQPDLRSAVTQLTWQDDRARVVFAAVAFDKLIIALEALQRDARLRVVEAAIAARVEPGMVRAEILLSR